MLVLLTRPLYFQAPILDGSETGPLSKKGKGKPQSLGNMKETDNTTMDFEPEVGPNWGKGETLTLNEFVNISVLKIRFCD